MPYYRKPSRDVNDGSTTFVEDRAGYGNSLQDTGVIWRYAILDSWRYRRCWVSSISNGWRDPAPFEASYLRVGFQPGVTTLKRIINNDGPPLYMETSNFKRTGNEIHPWAHLDAATRVPFFTTNNYSRLSTEVLLKLRDQKINLGESLAEVGKTAKHLSETAQQVLKAALAAKRGNFGQAARHLGISKPSIGGSSKDAAKKWMEYQYAWMPLLNEIEGTYDVLRGHFNKEPEIRVTRKIEETVEYPFNLIDHLSGWDRSGTSKATMRMTLYATVQMETLRRASAIGLTSPLQVAWAVQPFSFLTDWFLPVGNVLDALTAPLGFSFKAGFASMKVEQDSVTKDNSYAVLFPFGYEMSSRTPRVATVTIRSFLREPIHSFPTPRPYIKSPFTSLERGYTVAALVRQLGLRSLPR